MARLNKMEEINVLLIHIATLLSVSHSSYNSADATASFRDSGVTLHLEEAGLPVCHVNIKECRCLLHQFELSSMNARDDGGGPPGENHEANIPL
jgi:hypothetical protein